MIAMFLMNDRTSLQGSLCVLNGQTACVSRKIIPKRISENFSSFALRILFSLGTSFKMKKSTINFTVDLDAQNVPEKIYWEATDKPDPKLSETKAICIALWDHEQKNTLRIDLWAKDM